MAVKISALPAGDVQDEDVLPIVDVSSSTTKKVSVEGIRSGVSLQRAYSAGTTVEISAANGPVRLEVADGEETALEIETEDQDKPALRLVGALNASSSRTEPLLELVDGGANPSRMIALGDIGGRKLLIGPEIIDGGTGHLVIQGGRTDGIGGGGHNLVVRAGRGQAGDGITPSGDGGHLILSGGPAGPSAGGNAGADGGVLIVTGEAIPAPPDPGVVEIRAAAGVAIDGDLSVTGNVEIRAAAGVAIGGDTAIVGDLSVTGDVTVTGQVIGASLPKHNFAAVTVPTASDDETKGYSVGSRWVVPGAGELVCLDATAGAAVWALAAEANPSPVVEPDGSVPMTGALTLQAISDPGAEAGAVRIYGKDVGGVTHLHAQSDDGTVHQITGPVAPETDNTDTITVDGSNHGQVISCTSETAITVTADQAPDGTTVSLIQMGFGQITVTAGSGVVLVHPATFAPKSAERYSKIVLYWLAPSIVHVSGHLEEAG